MRNSFKKILLIGGVLTLCLIGGAYIMYQQMMGPLYYPGDLTAKAEYQALLTPVEKADQESFFYLNQDISLFYETSGMGPTPAVVVHGGPGIPYERAWDGLNMLGDQFTFYYYHQRGCGKSTRPIEQLNGNYYENMLALHQQLGLPAQIADLEHIRQKLGQEKLVLIGHSFGGLIASLYAIEFPERVDRLILVTPADVIRMPSGRDGLYGVVRNKLPESEQPAYDALIERMLDYGGIFDKSEPQLVEETLEFAAFYGRATGNELRVNPEMLGGWIQPAMFMSMGAQHDYSEYLAQIQAPTLVLHGEEDLIQEASLQDYLDHIPGVAFLRIKGGSHAAFYDAPVAFGEAVKEFLGK